MGYTVEQCKETCIHFMACDCTVQYVEFYPAIPDYVFVDLKFSSLFQTRKVSDLGTNYDDVGMDISEVGHHRFDPIPLLVLITYYHYSTVLFYS